MGSAPGPTWPATSRTPSSTPSRPAWACPPVVSTATTTTSRRGVRRHAAAGAEPVSSRELVTRFRRAGLRRTRLPVGLGCAGVPHRLEAHGLRTWPTCIPTGSSVRRWAWAVPALDHLDQRPRGAVAGHDHRGSQGRPVDAMLRSRTRKAQLGQVNRPELSLSTRTGIPSSRGSTPTAKSADHRAARSVTGRCRRRRASRSGSGADAAALGWSWSAPTSSRSAADSSSDRRSTASCFSCRALFEPLEKAHQRPAQAHARDRQPRLRRPAAVS